MDIEQAIRILDPTTTRDALWDIEYYAGFDGEVAKIKAVEDACVVAIDIMKKQLPMKPIDGTSCPTCGEEIVYDIDGCYGTEHIRPNYCPNCGQAINRSYYNA